MSIACLCWALDHNLTRKISASDSLFIAAAKGLVAGVTNTMLALAVGARLPAAGLTCSAMTVGLVGYGVNLVLHVLALRGLGGAGAYFATASFVGAALAIALLHEPLSPAFCVAAVLMGMGVWLHLTEHHEREHAHEFLEHDHVHRHDSHHQHVHAFAWDGRAARAPAPSRHPPTPAFPRRASPARSLSITSPSRHTHPALERTPQRASSGGGCAGRPCARRRGSEDRRV